MVQWDLPLSSRSTFALSIHDLSSQKGLERNEDYTENLHFSVKYKTPTQIKFSISKAIFQSHHDPSLNGLLSPMPSPCGTSINLEIRPIIAHVYLGLGCGTADSKSKRRTVAHRVEVGHLLLSIEVNDGPA